MKPRRYVTKFRRDDDSLWFVDVSSLRGAHTQARTIATGRARIREVIALVEDLEDESAIVLDERFELGLKRDVVAEARAARREADDANARATAATAAAAKALIKAGISFRDAGELLGITGGRVHQVSAAGSAKSAGSARASTGKPRAEARPSA